MGDEPVEPDAWASGATKVELLEKALGDIAFEHRAMTLDVLDYECTEDARDGCTHGDDGQECPTTPVKVCRYCWEIREEAYDEAPTREEDRYPCETMKIIIFARARIEDLADA